MCFFFFSSRRRHTRLQGDWSSDVCSSDLFGLRVSDPHGMKAMRRAQVEPIVRKCRNGTDLFDTELVLRADRAGLGVSEVPVTVEERRPPRSPIAYRVLRTIVGLVRLRAQLWTERGKA